MKPIAGRLSFYKFTPGGVKSVFASGLGINNLDGLAFDSAGNLFASKDGAGHIFEFTPGGVQSTFTTALTYPGNLAFSPVPEPSFFGLLAIGAAALGFGRARRQRAVEGQQK